MNKNTLPLLQVGDMIVTHDAECFYVLDVDERWFETYNYKLTWMREGKINNYSHRYIEDLVADGTASILRVIK
jgi:hypothetical protein